MRDGLAWRWIGYHAAAFSLAMGLHAFTEQSFFASIMSGTQGWIVAVVLAVGVALGQWAATRARPGAGFIAVRTFVGLIVGAAAGLGAGRSVVEYGMARLTDIYAIGRVLAWGWFFAAASEGLFLALAHSVRGRGPAWAWGLGLSWAGVRALPAALFLAQEYPLSVWGLGVPDGPLLDVGMSTASGAVLGAVTYPLLKRALAQDAPSPA